MPLRTALVALFLLSATSVSASHASAADPPVKKVLIFGLDGTRIDTLLIAKAPNLHQLIAEGALAENAQILGQRYRKNDTVSGPGWSSNLTGVWADKHGVNDNNVAKNQLEKYPCFFQHLKEVQPKAVTVSLDDWPPISQFIVRSADVSQEMSIPKAKDDTASDAHIADEASRLLTESNPDAMFVYFGNIDLAGHAKGFHPTVPTYRAAIERVDGLIGQVLTALKNRKTYGNEDWLVIVTTDHGGKGKGHGGGHNSPEILNGFLIVSGPAATRGRIEGPTYIVDLVPTALAHLGVPIKAEWGLDGHAVGLKTGGEKTAAVR